MFVMIMSLLYALSMFFAENFIDSTSKIIFRDLSTACCMRSFFSFTETKQSKRKNWKLPKSWKYFLPRLWFIFAFLILLWIFQTIPLFDISNVFFFFFLWWEINNRNVEDVRGGRNWEPAWHKGAHRQTNLREVHIIAEDLGVSSIKVWKIVAYFRGAQLATASSNYFGTARSIKKERECRQEKATRKYVPR